MAFPPLSFSDVAADFAGASGFDFGSAGPSQSGDISHGDVDFGTFNFPGITRGFDFNNPLLLIGAAVVIAAILIARRK